MSKEFTKSYAIKRISELLEENTELKKENTDLKELIESKNIKINLLEEKNLYYKDLAATTISFCIKQLDKMKDLYKKHLDYERIYDGFRVVMLEEDIETLINNFKEVYNEK